MKLFATLLLNVILLSYAPLSHAQTVVGWLEDITILTNNKQITLPAKIDSGADHSSIHATNIIQYTKNNQAWIKFTTYQNYVIETPFYKETKIKTKKEGFQSRPVILLNVCIAGEKRKIEVNLVNRSHFSKPLLIGRSALKGILIDPNQTHLVKKRSCIKQSNYK
ncbi:ATP-dependent zinc protease [Thiomicrorhabdus sp.]|uniref:ATP-dependent zinc protease family protein n=1 Tax=Thiomicrorhabdus sp. TaxID=2039724 RepID=UPI002AA6A980|nr:ATP-dependent zinc protease [Thiomicrorhabdus sp.]